MRTISCAKTVNIPKLKRVRDLEYCEGPLLSQFKDENGGLWLFSWCDLSETCHRWLVFNVTPEVLSTYLEGKSTFTDFLLAGTNRGFVDLDGTTNSIDSENWVTTKQAWDATEIPECYMPTGTSYYNPEFAPESEETMLPWDDEDQALATADALSPDPYDDID